MKISEYDELVTPDDGDLLVANHAGVTKKVTMRTVRGNPVETFNTRRGAVTLQSSDLNGLSGAGLTGITGGTGGVANTGSTTIGADTDEDDVGTVALQTRNITRLLIQNDGTVEVIGPLLVSAGDVNFIFEGDSRTSALGMAEGEDWPARAMELPFFAHGTKNNVAVSGSWIDESGDPALNIVDRYATEVFPLRPAITGKPAYLFVFIGINDINGSGDDAATIFARLESYWATAKADGFIVVACTNTPNGANALVLQITKQELDRLIRNATGQWDFLLDFALELPDPFDEVLFQETGGTGLHPTAVGHELLAQRANQGMSYPRAISQDAALQQVKGLLRLGALGINDDLDSGYRFQIKGSGGIAHFVSNALDEQCFFQIDNGDGTALMVVGIESAAGGTVIVGAPGSAACIGTSAAGGHLILGTLAKARVDITQVGKVIIKPADSGANFNVASIPEYADNAAAIAGSLVAGDVYRTGDAVKIVHA